MSLARRRFLQFAAAAGALPLSQPSWALDYPARPVRIVVGFPAGGPSDVVARLAADWLSERLGQQFVVENRPGAGGTVGTEDVVRARPDGYTLLLVATPEAIAPSLYRKLNFNLIRDIAPVASIRRGPFVMEVNPSLPVKTVPEFIAYAKANPGKIGMASAGIGTPAHVAGELFKMMAGVDMLHVPYRGSAPSLVDLMGGAVQVTFDPVASSIGYIKAGQLRALAVTMAKRWETLPELPTVGDFVPGYEASGFTGIGAPRNTPVEIIDKLNKEVNLALADPGFKARNADLGGMVLPGSPADFGSLIAADTEKWGKVVKFAGIEPADIP